VAFCVLLFVLSQVADTGNLLIIRQMTSDTNAFPLLFLMKAYAASTALSFLLDFWRIWAVIVGGVDASQKIYNQHFRALNSSTLSWLEGIPISRILQRSSTDQNTLDTALYSRIMFFVTDWVYALSTGIVLIYLMPFFALPALLYTCAAMFLVRAYSQVVQDLKRLESVHLGTQLLSPDDCTRGASRSPLVTYVAEVFAGRITFRAFGTLDLMLESASTLVEDFVRPQ
jgi:ABC-type multidrug transport system fused ATPase/permease subunit